jgi:hypothetical protein
MAPVTVRKTSFTISARGEIAGWTVLQWTSKMSLWQERPRPPVSREVWMTYWR